MAAQPQGCRCPFLARRLKDPQQRARVEAAERLGISLRRLNGWEPAETTEHEYDDAGRLVRSVTTREPEWDEEQAGWMLALQMWRASRCPHCGGDIADCTAPDADGRYTVPPPTRCHRTTALSRAQDQYRETPQREALLWTAERR